MGCVVFPGEIPASLDDGVKGPGFPVEVYNVLGAGDAFMAGFLRGWLRGEPLETACAYANACGAFAVSRLLCSPEYPTWEELQHFLRHGAATPRLRLDPALSRIHWATTRRPTPTALKVLAVDHRVQLEAMADRLGVRRERISAFKRLAVRAAAEVARISGTPAIRGRGEYGLLLDSIYGREALFEAADLGFWIGRPVEKAGSRPLAFETPDLGSHLAEWPLAHTVKCLCHYHPGDAPDLKDRQEAALICVYDACRTTGRELLVEIVSSKHGPMTDTTTADVLQRLYAVGLRPDWWKLEPQTSSAAWHAVEGAIRAGDPYCRGVVVLGLDAPEANLVAAFRLAAARPVVKGFAVGRTIFSGAAEAWLAGRIGDEEAVAGMAERFGRLCRAWDEAREARTG
jgi:5-dehydro-2-deoxygluconokinase